MKPKFSAFHGKQEIKDKYIARMKAHMAADDMADRAYRAYMADMADMADAMRAKFIELIKNSKN